MRLTKTQKFCIEAKIDAIDAKIIWYTSRLSKIPIVPSSSMDYFDKTIPKYIAKDMINSSRLSGIMEGLEIAKEILLRG